MRRGITIGAVALAAALMGAGAASAVASATASTTASAEESPVAGPESAAPGNGRAFGPMIGARGERMLYGESVSAGKDGTRHFHVWQRGTVTSASPTSVAVRSTDGTTWTWTVNDDTKVRSKGDEAKVADVKKGDEVLIAGSRSGAVRTAVRIADPPPDLSKLRDRRKNLRERLKDLREDMPRPEHT